MPRPAFVLIAVILAGHAWSAPPIPAIASAASWPEADALFHQDPRWLGADAAYSVDLGRERVLWLFGDTFIATDTTRSRRHAKFIRNSIGLQRGYDPSKARIVFGWHGGTDAPSSYFPEQDDVWLWPGGPIRIDDGVLVFLMRVKKVEGGLGFKAFGWTAAFLDHLDDNPAHWQLHGIETPSNPFHVIVGSAGVVRDGDFLYALGSDEESHRHDMCLVRWPMKEVQSRNLSAPQWWDADRQAWVPQPSLLARPRAIFTNGQAEFTVHFDRRSRRWLEVQSRGFGATTLALRTAEDLRGPWSDLEPVFRPPEMSQPHVMIYAGKAHPELRGADLILTYAVNAGFERVLDDQSVYYPRFVRLTFK